MTIVFDVSRLIARKDRDTPTGIDRFEVHYAAWISDFLGEQAKFVETTALGPHLIDSVAVRRLIGEVRSKWLKSVHSNAPSARLRHLAAAIDGEASWRPLKQSDRAARQAPSRILQRVRTLASAAAYPPRFIDPALINVSHARLDRESAFAWLRSSCRSVFYIHDLIPLSHPEFVRKGEPLRHERRVRTILRYGGLVLCNSQMTQSAFQEVARRLNLPCPAASVAAPGVEDVFLKLCSKQRLVTRRPYFVCVGTIEPRKNHALLLDVWRLLAERDGKQSPSLVIAGRRGWAQPELLSRLDALGPLNDSVFEADGLDDSELASLVAGASGLLAPSLVEGYDMPVVEALALGTPVIASDIGAHYETTGGAATLVSPDDCRSWLASIDAHTAQRRRCARRHHRTWEQHFEEVEGLLSTAPIPERGSDWSLQYGVRYRYGC